MPGMDVSPAGRERFTRAVRLGANRNYRYVYRKGKSYPSRNLTLVYLKGRGTRVGFSVSAKVGNAVVRNRLRRYMREDVRKILFRMKMGRYIFVARPSAKDASHDGLTRELQSVLSRAKLFLEDRE